MYEEEITYRIYVTDTLKLISGVDKRYYDFIERKTTSTKEETRTPDEIINTIRGRLNELV